MITIADVDHVAKLARLTLSEQEKKLYTEQLAKIIGYFDELKALDTSGIEPMSHALAVLNVMRQDKVVQSPGHEVLLKTAPQTEGNFFRVPKIGE